MFLKINKKKQLLAINHFPDPEVNNKSKELISKHQMHSKLDQDCEIVEQVLIIF